MLVEASGWVEMVSPRNKPEGGFHGKHFTTLDWTFTRGQYHIALKPLTVALSAQGKIEADRKSLGEWVKGLPGPWVGAMEATIFTGWVYDFLKPYAVDLKVAHPEMLKAITAAKKKNDRADAEMIADLLRVNLLPECHMLSEEIRELRRILAVSQPHCPDGGQDAEQDVRSAHGSWGPATARNAFTAKNTSMSFWNGSRKSLLR